jgi:YD repeat-containing protein
MTLAAWVQPSATQSGWRTILQRETDAYVLNASNSNGPLLPSGGGTIGGGFQWVSGSTANPVGTWTHVALTYDGTTLRLYVNGVQVTSKAVTGSIQSTTSPLWIGGNSPYGEYFNGRIDEVRVYRAALSQAEIQADMAAPLGGPPDTTVPSQVLGLAASAVSAGRVDLSWSAASDNVGVTKVEFYRDGILVGTDAASPYSVAFSTTTVANGSHSFVAKAYDAAGNRTVLTDPDGNRVDPGPHTMRVAVGGRGRQHRAPPRRLRNPAVEAGRRLQHDERTPLAH